jgi:hypothetical protein
MNHSGTKLRAPFIHDVLFRSPSRVVDQHEAARRQEWHQNRPKAVATASSAPGRAVAEYKANIIRQAHAFERIPIEVTMGAHRRDTQLDGATQMRRNTSFDSRGPLRVVFEGEHAASADRGGCAEHECRET